MLPYQEVSQDHQALAALRWSYSENRLLQKGFGAWPCSTSVENKQTFYRQSE